MKKLTLFMLVFLCLQGIQAQPNPDQEIRQAVSTLDSSYQYTHMLYGRGYPYQPWPWYDGNHFADSLAGSKESLLMTYGMQFYALNDTSTQQSLLDFSNELDSLSQKDTVFLGLFYNEYDRVKSHALDSNLIALIDTQYYDVAGRTENPYYRDTLFNFHLTHNQVDLDTIPFMLSSDLFFSYTSQAPDSIQIDFDDTHGFQTVQFDQLYSIYYDTEGTKRIRIKAFLGNGQILRSQANTQAKVSSQNLWEGLVGQSRNGDMYAVTPVPILTPLEGVQVFLFANQECEEREITRPLIIIDGFDPLNLRSFGTVLGLLGLNTGTPNALAVGLHNA